MACDINPVAFYVGPLAIHWYGIAMAVAAVFGIIYFTRIGTRLGYNEDSLLSLAFAIIISGVAGARLLFVAANFPHWLWTDPLQVFKIYEGGLAWHGALIGGILAGWVFLRIKPHFDFNTLADLTVPGIACGYVLIRFANIVNNEVLGRFAELGFTWPAQLFGAAIGAIMLARHFYLARHSRPAGYLFWSFILYHQLLRALFEETIREMPLLLPIYSSAELGIGLFTAAQIATIPIILLAWFMLRRAAQHSPVRRLHG